MSELVSDTPSSPDSWLIMSSNCAGVICSLRARNDTRPGSRSPVRVPITRPAAGVNPMLVSTHSPFRHGCKAGAVPKVCKDHANACSALPRDPGELFDEIGIGEPVEPVSSDTLPDVASRNRQQLGHARHAVVKSRVETRHLQKLGMTRPERLDQLDLARQMIGGVGRGFAELFQDFWRDASRFGSRQTVNDAVADGTDGGELSPCLEPVEKNRRSGLTGRDGCLLLALSLRLPGQRRARASNPVELSVQQRRGTLSPIDSKLDARRPAIDGENRGRCGSHHPGGYRARVNFFLVRCDYPLSQRQSGLWSF